MSVQTVYEAYKPASEYLMEYYTWIDILDIERREFNEHAESIERHCKILYENFEKTAEQEKKREENSKSARVARKLEQASKAHAGQAKVLKSIVKNGKKSKKRG